ncbi:MAG: isoprenylcysteine carboxylmethyltransferase family protein [Desulfobaccales bacterium]
MDDVTLKRKALSGLAKFLVILCILIFLPAWSLAYWQGWVFFLTFSISTTVSGLYFLKNDPKLVETRLKAGPAAEKEKSQKIIMAFMYLFFIALVVFPGLDHHFGWSQVPPYLVILGDILVVLGLFIYCLAFRENSYASAIIEVGKEQRVISTGPYAVIRHPVYSGAIIMLWGIPLALGSWGAFFFVFLLLAAIVWRLLDEEKFSVKNLPGYPSYCQKMRYRLIPFIW